VGAAALAWLSTPAPGAAAESPQVPGGTVISAAALGARGDGVHDDAPAIRAAMASLPAAGGTVALPTGVFLLGSGVDSGAHLPDGASIRTALLVQHDHVRLTGTGDGTVLRLGPHTKLRALTIAAAAADVDHLAIDGNRAQRDGSRDYPDGDVVDALLYVGGGTQVHVSACNVHDGIEDGIGTLRARSVSVSGCTVHDNGTVVAGGIGVALNGSDQHVSDCTIRDNTAAGIVVSGDGGDSVERNTVTGNRKTGIAVAAPDVRVTGNQVRGNGTAGFAGIDVRPPGRADLRGNAVAGNGTRGGDEIVVEAGAVVNADWRDSNGVPAPAVAASGVNPLLVGIPAGALVAGGIGWALLARRRR
jgi:parallel beta-helix repeat protein